MSIAKYIRFFLLIGITTILWLAPPAYADGDPLSGNACLTGFVPPTLLTPTGNIITPTPFTSEVVYCVQYTVQQAVTSMLVPLCNDMAATVGVMFILALMAFGIRVMLEHNRNFVNRAFGMIQEPNLKKPAQTTAFLLRLGIVGMFSYNLGSSSFAYPGGMVQAIYDIEQELLTLVSGGFSPWAQIDYFLGMLIGFAPGIVLFQGLLGIITGALFSSTAGIAVFFSGVMALIKTILFMFDVVYTYLMAMVVIGFQLILSAFTVPVAIFFHTEKYFTKWLKMLISAMLVPVLLFAFLSLFLGIFNLLIANILTILGSICAPLPFGSLIPPNYLSTCTPADFHSFWENNVPLTGWTMTQDPYYVGQLQNANPTGVNLPGMQIANNPLVKNGASAFPFTFPRIDFGGPANNWTVMAQLTFSFVALWIFASMMKSIAEKMPKIAEDIAQSVSGVSMQSSPLSKPVEAIMQKIKKEAEGT